MPPFVCYNEGMEKSTKKTLRVVLTIALVIVALNVLFWVLLFVSCKKSADERAAQSARFTELLGEVPAAVSLNTVSLVELRSGFDYTSLLEEAAEGAVRALNAPAVERDLRLNEDDRLLDGSSLYMTARYFSSEGQYSLVLRADLFAHTAEALYAAEGTGCVDLLSAEDGALFWYDGCAGAAVLYDAEQECELAREEGELHAAGEFVWRYAFPPGTVTRENILFFGQEGRALAAYSYPLSGETEFLLSPRGVERGVAYADAEGGSVGIDVRTGALLDAAQCERHLAYAPFAYGWEQGEEDALYKDGSRMVIDADWVCARSDRAAQLLQLDEVEGLAAYAKLLDDGTPCIRLDIGKRAAWWSDEYSLLYCWTERDTLEYMGCLRSGGYGSIVCRWEEA